MKYVIAFAVGTLVTVVLSSRSYPTWKPYLQAQKPLGPRFRE